MFEKPTKYFKTTQFTFKFFLIFDAKMSQNFAKIDVNEPQLVFLCIWILFERLHTSQFNIFWLTWSSAIVPLSNVTPEKDGTKCYENKRSPSTPWIHQKLSKNARHRQIVNINVASGNTDGFKRKVYSKHH